MGIDKKTKVLGENNTHNSREHPKPSGCSFFNAIPIDRKLQLLRTSQSQHIGSQREETGQEKAFNLMRTYSAQSFIRFESESENGQGALFNP